MRNRALGKLKVKTPRLAKAVEAVKVASAEITKMLSHRKAKVRDKAKGNNRKVTSNGRIVAAAIG